MSDGYCMHGKYVGGIGIDWMCGMCEDGAVYLITGLPLWEVYTEDGLLGARRKFEDLNDGLLNLVADFPDNVFLSYREDDVAWGTEEDAREALEEGYTVVSPYKHDELVGT